MLIWFKLGWRNLLKNRRRTLFTIGAIALGFAAINIVIGFMLYVLRGLEDSYVYTFEGGHLTITKSLSEAQPTKNRQRIFDAAELQTIEAACKANPAVLLATPRLQLTGMLNNGNTASIMFAEGKVAKDSHFIREQGRGISQKIQMYEGTDLADAGPYDIAVSKGLARKLNLKIGQSAIAMSSTLDGYMNAMDGDIVQLQDAPLEILDDMAVTLPFSYAQELLDTTGADSVVVLLAHGTDLNTTATQLTEQLTQAGLEVTLTNWKDLRVSYHRIRSMFNVLFGFVLIIVLMIIALSIINTVSMAAMERTREIGTLRAIGLKRSGVIALFTSESVLLAGLGSLVGCVIYLICWQIIQSVEPTWIPPNIPKRVPWEITWAPQFLILSFFAMELLTTLATIIPARRASRLEISDALGHI